MFSSAAALSIGVGVSIGLISSLIQSLGLTLQRKSHVLNQRLPESQQKAEYRRPLWLLGLLVFVTSNLIGSLVQIASLPVVILAPLGAISLLWNALFARLLLGDVFSKRLVAGTILITGGAVLIAFFGIVPDSERARDLEELMRLWRRGPFVVWFSIESALVLICLVITHIIDFSFSRRAALELPETSHHSPVSQLNNPSTLTTGVADTISSALPTESTPLLRLNSNKAPSIASTMISVPPSKVPLLLSLSYASMSGIISGACILLAKSGVSLLLLTLAGNNQFRSVEAWLLLLGLVFCALGQLWYLHKALILASPTIVCPSAFCAYNVSSILNGLIYFDQFGLLPPLYLGLVTLGTVILLIGVWIVSIQQPDGGVALDTWEPETESDSDLDSICESPTVAGPDVPPLIPDIPAPDSHDPVHRLSQSETSLGMQPSLFGEHHHRRRPSLTLHPHGSGASAHRRHSAAPLSPPLGVGVGGFQIGLSPVSPGFAIRPERGPRRRIASLQAEEGHLRHSPQICRRTVSEGENHEGDVDGGEETQLLAPAEPPKRKWRWLRR